MAHTTNSLFLSGSSELTKSLVVVEIENRATPGLSPQCSPIQLVWVGWLRSEVELPDPDLTEPLHEFGGILFGELMGMVSELGQSLHETVAVLGAVPVFLC